MSNKIKAFTLSCKSFRSHLSHALRCSRFARCAWFLPLNEYRNRLCRLTCTLWQKSASQTKYRNRVAHSYAACFAAINEFRCPTKRGSNSTLCRKAAFTLAETLITLTILGVVAAIMVNGIINNYQKRITITKLKKIYSKISNNIDEIRILNNCQNIECILTSNNYTYPLTSHQVYSQSERLKLFFPELQINSSYQCIPQKIYSLNGYEYSGNGNIYLLGGAHFYGHCFKDFSILLWNYSLTKSNKLMMLVYTGKKNDRAVIGRNLFFLEIDNNGKFTTSGNCDSNTTDENVSSYSSINGVGCLKRIMQNNWKIDY